MRRSIERIRIAVNAVDIAAVSDLELDPGQMRRVDTPVPEPATEVRISLFRDIHFFLRIHRRIPPFGSLVRRNRPCYRMNCLNRLQLLQEGPYVFLRLCRLHGVGLCQGLHQVTARMLSVEVLPEEGGYLIQRIEGSLLSHLPDDGDQDRLSGDQAGHHGRLPLESHLQYIRYIRHGCPSHFPHLLALALALTMQFCDPTAIL